MASCNFNFTSNIDIKATSSGIFDSLLRVPEFVELYNRIGGGRGDGFRDLLTAFRRISETLEENANYRWESLSTAEEELSAAANLLEEADHRSRAAYRWLEAVDNGNASMLDPLNKEYEANATTEAGRAAASAYRNAISTAYEIAMLASKAAASAMDATISEVRAAAASRVAPAASEQTAEFLAADAKTAADMAKEAAIEASALALQGGVESQDLWMKLRDSAPEGMVEGRERGGKGLEMVTAMAATGWIAGTAGVPAVAAMAARKAARAGKAARAARAATAITEEATATMVGMLLHVQVKAADAEQGARNASSAVVTAEAEAAACTPEEKIVRAFLEELDSLIHTNGFLKLSLGGTTVGQQLPEDARKVLLELESSQLHKLAQFSRQNRDKSSKELLEGSLEIMREIGQTRKDLVRQEILKLSDLKKLDELNQFLDHGVSERGFLRNDLVLRREGLTKRETGVAPGETMSVTEFYPKANCIYKGKYMRAAVYPGATCNVVSEEWVKKHNVPQVEGRNGSLRVRDDYTIENCPLLVGPLMLKVNNGPSTHLEDEEFLVVKKVGLFKEDAVLGLPILKPAQVTHGSTGELLFPEYGETSGEEDFPPDDGPTIEETTKDICDSLLDFPKLLDSESSEESDLLSALGEIFETLKENAKNRRERLKTAAAELSAAEELLEAAEDQSKAARDLSDALDKAKDAVLDFLKKRYGPKPTRTVSREADRAYQAISMAYSTSRSASAAAASAVEATVSEVRVATTSRVSPAAASGSADVNAAAGVAKAAAKEASTLAIQAAAESLALLKKLRDSAPRGTREKIERGIKELEAMAAVTEATTGVVGEMVSQTEGKAADAEKAARNAAAAAEAAEAAGGTTEAPEGAVEGARPPKERVVQEIMEELDTLIHTNDFLKQSLGGATVWQKLPEETRKSLSELDSLQRRELAEYSQKSSEKSPKGLLEGKLKIMRKISQTRQNLVRDQILKLSDFEKLDVLNQFLDREDSEQGFLRNYLELRREILKKREAALEKPGKGPSHASPAETAAAPRETNLGMDSLSTMNCMFNNNYMRAVVDPGATCNIVSEAWIKKHNMPQAAKRYETLLLADGSIVENCPCVIGSLMLKVKNGPSTYLRDVEFAMCGGFKNDALLGLPLLKLARITQSSTGQLLFAEHEIYSPTIEATSKDICDSVLDFPKLLDPESSVKGDLLSAFGKISETLEENANKRRESLKAAAAELSAAEKLLGAADDQSKAAHELSETLGKAKDAVLEILWKDYEAEPTRHSQQAGWAYHAINEAYSAARSASAAAASAMDATVSEVRVATASRVAPATSKRATSASAAEVNAAAGVANAAAKEASTLAVQAAAGSLGLLKNFRSIYVLPPGEIERGIKELEAIAAITEATTGTVGEMILQAEGKAASVEETARYAAGAAEAAGGAAEAAERTVEEAAAARPPAEKIVQVILDELDNLVHTKDFLKKSIGGTTVHQKLPEETQKSLSELDSLQQRKLAEFSRNNSDKSPEELLEATEKIMSKLGQYRKDLIREQILKLSDFQKFDELNQFLDPEDSERGYLSNDLELRRENLKKQDARFKSSEECLYCASPPETVPAPGGTGSTTDLRLSLNCIFRNKLMRALVDTGASCNVVSEDWIKKHNLPQEAKRTESLLSANGSVTKDCPCLTGLWMLQDKGASKTVWKDVEFVMLEGYKGDALLGMPFLKLTQIIHNSAGEILFPEFKEASRGGGAPRPVFPKDTTGSK